MLALDDALGHVPVFGVLYVLFGIAARDAALVVAAGHTRLLEHLFAIPGGGGVGDEDDDQQFKRDNSQTHQLPVQTRRTFSSCSRQCWQGFPCAFARPV